MVETETIVFATLFIAQTIIYILLLRSFVMSQKESYRDIQSIIRRVGELERRTGDVASQLPNTAIDALKLLKEAGEGMSSTELSRRLGKSREHVARTMKLLYIRGFVERRGKPFKYYITDRGVSFLDIMENHIDYE